MVHGGGHHHAHSGGTGQHHHHESRGGGGDWGGGGSSGWNDAGQSGVAGGGWDWGWNHNQWNIGMNAYQNYYPQQRYPPGWWDGGGRWGWRNQWNHGMNYSSSPPYSPERYTSTNYQDADACGRCCRTCCLSCCTCWIASFVAQQTKCGPIIQWTFLSICIFTLLVFMSQMDETWTFNGGETRHLPVRVALLQQFQLQSQVANAFLVYDIDGPCPSLTGPKVSLDESWVIHLAPDDYEFDYFYLLEGSSLSVDFRQVSGATNISILKGTDALHKVQEGENYPTFSTRAVLTRYSSAASCHHADKGSHHGGTDSSSSPPPQSSPTVFTYTAPESNVYIVVYDNASSSPGDANATIHIELSTYDLSKQRPPIAACQALTCVVDTKRNQCLLLQAPKDVGVVTVHIVGKRRWFVIVGIALIPMLVGLGLQVANGHRETEHAVTDDATTISDTHQPSAPPSTNPDADAAAAAPMASAAVIDDGDHNNTVVDYESIPIVVADNVTPVPVPVVVDDKT